MFAKDSAFGQADTRRQEQETRRQMRIQREREAAEHMPLIPSPHVGDQPDEDGPPFENWHHDLITIDTLLDQHPPELRRARELLAEVADEIHSQFERIR